MFIPVDVSFASPSQLFNAPDYQSWFALHVVNLTILLEGYIDSQLLVCLTFRLLLHAPVSLSTKEFPIPGSFSSHYIKGRFPDLIYLEVVLVMIQIYLYLVTIRSGRREDLHIHDIHHHSHNNHREQGMIPGQASPEYRLPIPPNTSRDLDHGRVCRSAS